MADTGDLSERKPGPERAALADRRPSVNQARGAPEGSQLRTPLLATLRRIVALGASFAL